MQVRPKWRNGVGMGAILLLIIAWSALVATLAPWIGGLHLILQVVIYTIAGTAWIIPVRPLLSWMETGKWGREPVAVAPGTDGSR